MSIKAVILAAGHGTRMGKLTSDIPKPMLPISGKPMLAYILMWMKEAGIEDIALIVGYRNEVIEEYFGGGEKFGINIRYIIQEVPDGTGSAVHLAKDFAGEEPFMLSWGDIITEPENYRRLIKDFRSGENVQGVLGLNRVKDPWQGAAVYLDENRVIERIIEKPPKGTSTTSYNSSGVMILHPVVFEYTAKIEPSPRGEYEYTSALHNMLKDGLKLKGKPLEGFWCDVGRPEDIAFVESYLKDL